MATSVTSFKISAKRARIFLKPASEIEIGAVWQTNLFVKAEKIDGVRFFGGYAPISRDTQWVPGNFLSKILASKWTATSTGPSYTTGLGLSADLRDATSSPTSPMTINTDIENETAINLVLEKSQTGAFSVGVLIQGSNQPRLENGKLEFMTCAPAKNPVQ